MCDRLEFVVDEELGRHHDEAEGKQEAVKHGQHPRVPSLVLFVQQRVDAVAAQQRETQPRQILVGQLVVLPCARGHVRALVRELDAWNEA